MVELVTDPNGAESTFDSADVEHFPVTHRLTLGGGSERGRSWVPGNVHLIGAQLQTRSWGKGHKGTLGKPKAS